MRFPLTALLFCGLAFAQPPQTPQQSKVPDDKVVAEVDHKKYTAREVRELAAGLPPQGKQMFALNPAVALQQVLLAKHLAEEAAKKDLDKKSPNKEQLEFQRAQTLAQFAVSDFADHVAIPTAEQQKYYSEHGSDFEQAKVRVIYIAFSSGQAKSDVKVRTEAEAKFKVEDLRKQLAAGADFAKIAKESSEDKESAEKGGEWGIIRHNSKMPEEVLKAIFALKAGEVSQPIKQANGFYLLKVDEFSKQPYEEVANQIFEQMKSEQIRAWFEELNKRFNVKVEDTDFFPRPQPPASGSR
jgi:peptidyl-prolyl cis-trans isomerase C